MRMATPRPVGSDGSSIRNRNRPGGSGIVKESYRVGSHVRYQTYRERRRTDPRALEDETDKYLGGTRRARPQRSTWTLLSSLFGLLERDRLSLALTLSLVTLGTFILLIPPAATKILVDDVLVLDPERGGSDDWWIFGLQEPRERLIAIAILVFLATLAGALVSLSSRYRMTILCKRVQVMMLRRVFEHALRLPLHRVHRMRSGSVASLLRQDAAGVGDLLFQVIYNPWRAVVQFLTGLVVLAWIDPKLLLGTLALAPLAAWTDRLWHLRIRPLHRDVRRRRQEIDGSAAETFGGMRVVRAFGRQKRESRRFVVESHLMVRQELLVWWWSRAINFLWDIMLPLASGGLLIYGGLQVLEGDLTLGDLMMFLVFLAMLLEPIAVLATAATQFQNNLAGFDRTLDLLEIPREMADAPGHRVLTPSQVVGRVHVEGVSFTYPGTESPVLQEIDLEIEPGQMVALVGRSGAGKTTLCNLVARFYDPTEGRILVDGIDLREIRVESYRRLLGIVEQDVFLFEGTIAANIAYARPGATPEEIAQAARLANAEEFIEALPDGDQTWIGERGVRLSGGQRQRLAIARAILADPRILILDEATSNLDSQSERAIQIGMEGLLAGRTALVIAHRLSTIRAADLILVMEQGKIVERGSHEQLMEVGTRYRDMVDLQRLEQLA